MIKKLVEDKPTQDKIKVLYDFIEAFYYDINLENFITGKLKLSDKGEVLSLSSKEWKRRYGKFADSIRFYEANTVYTCDDLHILYDANNPDSKFLLALTGDGCQSHRGKLKTILRDINASPDAELERLDIAIDDYNTSPYLTPKMLFDAYNEKLFTFGKHGKSKIWRIYYEGISYGLEGKKPKPKKELKKWVKYEEDDIDTIYFSDGHCDTGQQLVVYNKTKEAKLDKPCIRTELRLRKQHANDILAKIIDAEEDGISLKYFALAYLKQHANYVIEKGNKKSKSNSRFTKMTKIKEPTWEEKGRGLRTIKPSNLIYNKIFSRLLKYEYRYVIKELIDKDFQTEEMFAEWYHQKVLSMQRSADAEFSKYSWDFFEIIRKGDKGIADFERIKGKIEKLELGKQTEAKLLGEVATARTALENTNNVQIEINLKIPYPQKIDWGEWGKSKELPKRKRNAEGALLMVRRTRNQIIKRMIREEAKLFRQANKELEKNPYEPIRLSIRGRIRNRGYALLAHDILKAFRLERIEDWDLFIKKGVIPSTADVEHVAKINRRLLRFGLETNDYDEIGDWTLKNLEVIELLKKPTKDFWDVRC